jgi:hypothetical protein
MKSGDQAGVGVKQETTRIAEEETAHGVPEEGDVFQACVLGLSNNLPYFRRQP